MTPQQLLLTLKARWWVVLLTLALVVTLVVGVTLVLPKQFTATAAVVVDVKSPDALNGLVMGNAAAGYMATQLDIINSSRVAQAVVRKLRLDQNLTVRQQWQDATGGQADLVNWLSAMLMKNLDVLPSRESNVINIAYSATDPQFAAAVANAYAQAYIEVNLELRVAPARQFAAFFEDQTKAARAQLEQTQAALSSYQQEHGITSADERLDYETARLNETSSQLTVMQGELTDSQSKRGGKSDTLTEVLQNPVINGLKTDVARQEAKLRDSLTNLGERHPQAQRARAELNSLKSQLASETQRVLAGIETTYQVGKQREDQLQAALATQKARVLELNKQRDDLAVLRREVESAQRSYEQVSGRASQTNLESQANQTNISLLTPAAVPMAASKPKVFLNALVSVILGTVLGIGLALALELFNRRVRSASDLMDALGLPVLGQIGASVAQQKHLAKGAAA